MINRSEPESYFGYNVQYGDNFSLRGVEPEDVDLLFKIESDPKSGTIAEFGAPLSRHLLTEYALNYDADPFKSGQLRLIISLHSDVVGLLDIFDISPRNRTAEVGIYILPEFRMEGVALHALEEGAKYCAQHLGLRSLMAKVLESNDKSHALFVKAGYRTVGKLTDWQFFNGTYQSVTIFQLKL
ncbi:MAG: GNAT family N-acetyltransferase [Muribaculaceae bacterium]|nr:GNAT family N-acetyltransferase [Muribaculaceae bacterium]